MTTPVAAHPTIRLSVSAVLAVATALTTSNAQADHAFYRSLDDALFSIAAEARALRWDVATAPIREVDRRVWLRGMDDIYDEVSDLQSSLFRCRAPHHLCRETQDLREEICELRDRLSRLGEPTNFRYERGVSGNRFRCGVLPGGCVLPTTFIARLDELDRQSAALHAAIERGPAPVIGYQTPTPDYRFHSVPRHSERGFNDAHSLPAPPLPGPTFNSPYRTPVPNQTTRDDRARDARRQAAMNTAAWFLSQLGR